MSSKPKTRPFKSSTKTLLLLKLLHQGRIVRVSATRSVPPVLYWEGMDAQDAQIAHEEPMQRILGFQVARKPVLSPTPAGGAAVKRVGSSLLSLELATSPVSSLRMDESENEGPDSDVYSDDEEGCASPSSTRTIAIVHK